VKRQKALRGKDENPIWGTKSEETVLKEGGGGSFFTRFGGGCPLKRKKGSGKGTGRIPKKGGRGTKEKKYVRLEGGVAGPGRPGKKERRC